MLIGKLLPYDARPIGDIKMVKVTLNTRVQNEKMYDFVRTFFQNEMNPPFINRAFSSIG